MFLFANIPVTTFKLSKVRHKAALDLVLADSTPEIIIVSADFRPEIVRVLKLRAQVWLSRTILLVFSMFGFA